MSEPLLQVAIDIETTGFGADDVVTVIGFKFGIGCRVFCQTAGQPAPNLEATVTDRVERNVGVSVHQSEAEMLGAVQEFSQNFIQSEKHLLVAYNGETWNGGFDLPFLRTRFAAHDLAWPFVDVAYADLLPLCRDLFNTRLGEDETSDLVGVYDLLCDGEYSAIDPFDQSDQAVDAFEEGQFEEVVVHNIADVLRTRRLGQLAKQYCSKSDFGVKSLTPVSQA